MALPKVRGVGAVAAGIGAVSPGWPTGTEAGDLGFMVAESGGPSAGLPASNALTAAGWEVVFTANGGGTLNTRLTVLVREATGSDATTTNDTGDHQMARIIGIEKGTWDKETPWIEAIAGALGTGKEHGVPEEGVIVEEDIIKETLVLMFVSATGPDANGTTEFTWTDVSAQYTSDTERMDNTTAQGDGGALSCWTGIWAPALGGGEVPPVSLTSVTSTAKNWGLIVLTGEPPEEAPAGRRRFTMIR